MKNEPVGFASSFHPGSAPGREQGKKVAASKVFICLAELVSASEDSYQLIDSETSSERQYVLNDF
ncbi:hypothetical protein [Niabella aurantiaca]|uniref:hypothetical protein n=1 Tax=Niabella aurantiaca TaxID=379900 RepID=UPI00038284CB|nr:hypothetical protein [Niabella aurantiaca]